MRRFTNKHKDATIGVGYCEEWYRDKRRDRNRRRWLCSSCYHKLVLYPAQKHRKYWYKGRTLYSDKTQRNNVCNWCRSIAGEINAQIDRLCKQTHLIHFSHDDANPEAHRLELCVACCNIRKQR